MPAQALAAITASDDLRALKNQLQARFPSVKSSHLTEAIACGFGFNTHAALRAALACGDPSALNPRAFEPLRMLRRLDDWGDAAQAHCIHTAAPELQTPPLAYQAQRDQIFQDLEALSGMRLTEERTAPIRRLHQSCRDTFAQVFDLGHYARQRNEHAAALWWPGVDHSQCLPGWGQLLSDGFFRFGDGSANEVHFFRPLPLPDGQHVMVTTAVASIFHPDTSAENVRDFAYMAGVWGWKCTRLDAWSWHTYESNGVLLCFQPSLSHSARLQQWPGSFAQWLQMHHKSLLHSASTSRRAVIKSLLRHSTHFPLQVRTAAAFASSFLHEFLRYKGAQLPPHAYDICLRIFAQYQKHTALSA